MKKVPMYQKIKQLNHTGLKYDIYHSIHYLFILENSLINKSMMLKLGLNRIEINKKLPKMFKLMEVNN